MTITYPLDFPTDIGMTDAVLRMRNATSMSQSPFSYSQQVYSWSGKRWELEVQMPRLKRDVAEVFLSFLASLKGSFGTFTCYVPSGSSPRSTYAQPATDDFLTTEGGDTITTEAGDNIILDYGDIVVFGSGQTGSSLTVSGYQASQSNVIREGDYFQLGTGLNTRLFKSLGDYNSNSSGNVTMDIWPNITTAPSNGQTVIWNNPKGLFRLDTNTVDIVSDYLNTYFISFTAIGVV